MQNKGINFVIFIGAFGKASWNVVSHVLNFEYDQDNCDCFFKQAMNELRQLIAFLINLMFD